LTSKVISIFLFSPIKLLTLYEITNFCENSTINIISLVGPGVFSNPFQVGVPYQNYFLPPPAPLPEPMKSPVGHVYDWYRIVWFPYSLWPPPCLIWRLYLYLFFIHSNAASHGSLVPKKKKNSKYGGHQKFTLVDHKHSMKIDEPC
jgi:hypothetical protein